MPRVIFTKLEWALIFLLIYILLFPLIRDYYTKQLFDIPITISPPGKIEADVHIPFQEVYYLSFRFKKDNNMPPEIRSIVGDGSRHGGRSLVPPIPLEVEVYSLPEMKLMLSNNILVQEDNFSDFSKSPAIIGRRIMNLDLEKGNYRIIVKSTSDILTASEIRGAIRLNQEFILNPRSQDIINSSISFSPTEKNERDINISSTKRYYLVLLLSGERSKLKEPYVDASGTSVPVSLKVYSLPDNKLVTEREIITNNTNGWINDWVERDISTLSFPPGDYKIILQIKEDIPSFKIFQMSLRMGLRGGFNSSTWQLTSIIWAGFLEPLVWSIAVILFFIVAYKRASSRVLRH